MDDFDVFASKPSTTTQEDDFLSDVGNPNETTNNPIEDSSWIIENEPASSILDTEPVTSSATIAESTPPSMSETVPSDTKPFYNVILNEETSPLYAINKKREEDIAAKDVEENRKITELRQQAKTDLERWYKERERQMEQNRQTMKSEEDDLRSKALEKSTKETCDWTKVIRLLELTDGTQLSKSKRDVTRMKSCMLTARRINENKKLANGLESN